MQGFPSLHEHEFIVFALADISSGVFLLVVIFLFFCARGIEPVVPRTFLPPRSSTIPTSRPENSPVSKFSKVMICNFVP